MRTKVSINEISESMDSSNSRNKERFTINKKRGQFRHKKLYSTLSVPSYVHGYSLAIEFMRSWFLEKFPKDYFKTVYINGKHVLDDYKVFNKDVIKREKPMVAIVPTIEFDNDRDLVDMYLADPSIFLKRSDFQQAFFKDEDRDMYLGLDFQTIKMNFNFRVRVSSRAEQLDLFKQMELMFRIGATQQKSISADFHIPKDIMLNIADRAGFKVDMANQRIEDSMEFLSYLNSHSELPIVFKLRAINQKPEYFIRIRDLYTHIATKDKLNVDDGEREGQLDNNFHIEMQAVLTMPIPHFYVFYQAEPLHGAITVYEEDKNSTTVGLYSFSDFEIPERNSQGWLMFALTSYMTDKHEKYIDLSDVMGNHNNTNIVMQHCLDNFISPACFMDVQVFKNDDIAMRVRSKMDFSTRTLELLDDVDEETLLIAIYTDRGYVNETISTLEQYGKSRINYNKDVK